MLLFCVLMGLYADTALPHVLRRIIGPQAAGAGGATAGALCQARYRLGARPVVALFRAVCRPLATATTPGAFLFGRRLMALDGTTVELPDTPANVSAFGRRRTPRGTGAWPQALLVLLVECGTRAVCDAGVWPGQADERRAGRRLLRSVGPGMLLLWDRGFQNVAMVEATAARGADFLGRLPATVTPLLVQALGDGTALVRLRASDYPRRRHGAHVVVRLIRYTLDDPQRPGHRAEHRLVTSLRDPAAAPARDLILAYHRRWEIESALDELKTYQRPARPLRSRKPVGVIQEIYGLLITPGHDIGGQIPVTSLADGAQGYRLQAARLRRMVWHRRSREPRRGKLATGPPRAWGRCSAGLVLRTTPDCQHRCSPSVSYRVYRRIPAASRSGIVR